MSTVKKLKIFYFSGTGNARQVALWFSKFAIEKNIDCQIFNIADTKIYPINPEALIFIISPIHGFNFPKITLAFIRSFPKGKNNIVLMSTRAGMKIGSFVTPGITGVAFLFSSLLLKIKGYKIIGQVPFDMPSNWISVHPTLNEKTVKFLHQKNYYRAEKHANKIFSGKKDFLAYRDIIQDVLVSPISLAYYLLGKYAFAKSFYASNNCDNCTLCIKKCPVHAIIEVNNRPFWTFKCESCMKCMNSCPKKAIETAHGLFAILILISMVITYLLDHFLSINISSGFVRNTVSSLIFILLLWGLYKIQHLLLRSKLIGKLISFTSFTHYKFWGRYKSIADYKWKK